MVYLAPPLPQYKGSKLFVRPDWREVHAELDAEREAD
jgi:hypothetical protein